MLPRAKESGLSIEKLCPLFDGSDGYTFFLSLLEADKLVPAAEGEYALLRD